MEKAATGKELFEWISSTISAAIEDVLQRVLGPPAIEAVLGAFSWSDLATALLLTLLTFLASAFVVWLLHREARRTEARPGSASWVGQILRAASAPARWLIRIGGIYAAITPLISKYRVATGVEPAPGLVDTLFDIAVFLCVIWVFIQITRVFEARWVARAGKTESRLDDLLVPLLVGSLRVIAPVSAVIFALPLIGLPPGYAGVISKGSGMLLIGAVAWVLFQAVHVSEKAVLARYDITADDNLQARKVYTQVHVLSKTLHVIIALFSAASILMLFEEVRRFGASLLASAGVIGIVVGFAAQRTIANLFAGFQLAITQPIRLDDVVIVEGEWGRIEEVTLTYVVVRIWDERRLIVPLSYFIEKPFQNWTRVSAELLGSVFIWVDYSLPLAQLRPAVEKLVETCKDWDRRFWNLQVTDTTERAMQVRILATAADSAKAWDLRCELREKLIQFLQQEHPASLPRIRAELGPAISDKTLRQYQTCPT